MYLHAGGERGASCLVTAESPVHGAGRAGEDTAVTLSNAGQMVWCWAVLYAHVISIIVHWRSSARVT